MASITSEPNDFTPVRGGDLQFCLQGSGSDLDTTGYQVFFDGAAISEIEEVGQGAFCIRPGAEMEKMFIPQIPDLGSTGPVADTEAVKNAYVQYGDITYDENDCSTTQNIGSSSATVKVVNSVVQDWMENPFAGTAVFPLTHRPEKMNIGMNQYDWISVFAPSGSAVVTLVKYFTDGSSTLQDLSLGQGVTIVPCGTANMPGGAPNTLFRYEVRIAGTSGKIYKYYINDCGCEDNIDFLFYEPIGGWSCLHGECLDSGSGSANGKRYCTVAPSGSDKATKMLYGQREYDFVGQTTISVKVNTPPDVDYAFFGTAFKAAKYKFMIWNGEIFKFFSNGSVNMTRGRRNSKISVNGFIEWAG